MIPVTLNHVALDVADRVRSAAFYRDLLGAETVADDAELKLTFLRLPDSANYSDLALHEHGDVEAAYPTDQIRMAHTGWAILDERHLVEAYDFFTEHTRVLFAADIGVARLVMGADPDGHVVEFELFGGSAVERQPRVIPLDIDALRDIAVV